MGSSRDNHYVAKWYQKGFLEPGARELAYLDLTPDREVLQSGRVIVMNDRFYWPPAKCFMQTDLYSTFFGAVAGLGVNDEIERRLFGEIDRQGALAIRAFCADDVNGWMQHFETLFEFMDIQKLRTPKGLAWLRTQYPPPFSQNELMREMQGLRLMHASLWSQCVREIVSAEAAGVKFITSDHPVTIYNPGLPPGADECAYPYDPSIALKGSQTLFPLDRDYLLILTNLEYARDPKADPLEKRTFARSFRPTITRTDAFIRTRKLTDDEVSAINRVISARAHRYLGGGKQAWLAPTKPTAREWKAVAPILAPPPDELWHFGGEVFVKMKDGRTIYQDEHGRREPEHQRQLQVIPRARRPGEACGCGSGLIYRDCCASRPRHLRPSWSERSIRQRNLRLLDIADHVFGLSSSNDWDQIRTEITDAKIRDFHEAYAALWPLETDLLSLLPKPDGRPRAVYTGILHPEAILDFAAGAGLYFGEILIENPMPHPRTIHPDHSPIDQPQSYRGEILKTLMFLMKLAPLIEVGLVTLFPDPCGFDFHLREQLHHMARRRTDGQNLVPGPTDRVRAIAEADARRAMMMMTPERVVLRDLRRVAEKNGHPKPTAKQAREGVTELKRRDPLAVMQAEPLPKGEAGAQLTMMRLSPNFEMAMYIAQATGAAIVTDSPQRWRELQDALLRRGTAPNSGLPDLVRAIARTPLAFPQNRPDIARFARDGTFAPYAALFRDLTSYVHGLETRARRPNYEAQLLARFGRAEAVQRQVFASRAPIRTGRMLAALPKPGIRDNTVNRLLLMSSAEHHWSSVPMAVLIKPDTAVPG